LQTASASTRTEDNMHQWMLKALCPAWLLQRYVTDTTVTAAAADDDDDEDDSRYHLSKKQSHFIDISGSIINCFNTEDIRWSSTASDQLVLISRKSISLENVVHYPDLWIHDLEKVLRVMRMCSWANVKNLTKIRPCVLETGGNMPPKCLFDNMWSHCHLEFCLVTSESNQFIFVDNCTEVVNLVKMLQVVSKITY